MRVEVECKACLVFRILLFAYTTQLAPGIISIFLPKSKPYTVDNYGEIKQISHHNSRNYSMEAVDGFNI